MIYLEDTSYNRLPMLSCSTEEESANLVDMFKIFDDVTVIASTDGGAEAFNGTMNRILSGNKKARTR